MKKKNLLILLFVLQGVLLQAQTWDGSTNTSWNEPTNWSTNAVPTATGNVTIPGSLTNYPVLANNVTINSIDMLAGSQLNFNGFNLTITTASSAFSYFTGATLNNSNAGTDIVVNITTGPGYNTYVRSTTVNDNITFNMSGPAGLFEADGAATGNHFTGDIAINFAAAGGLYLSDGDTSRYDGNLTINRTVAGLTDAFNSGAVIGGNFSFTNNTAGSSLFGIGSRRTSIAGTINIAINNTTPGSFELIRLINQTGGGTINVQNSRGFDVRNDTLIVSSFNITGYRGSDFGYLYNNDIEGNVTIADDATHTAGYNTYIRANEITGNASFTSNSNTNIFDADVAGSGNHYTGNVSFTATNIGGLYISNADTSLYDANLTINRTGAGTTDAFNSGAVIGGNFSFTNNTAGSSLFGVVTRRTSIAGTINIAINNTTPGSFELLRLINQTGGGTINVQNSIGFDVRNDTLIVSSFNITGYRGSDFGYLYNNDIEGNVTIADDATHTAGYNTYIRANEITGNASFTSNSNTNIFDADVAGSGNHYTGNVSFTATNIGGLYISNADTSLYDANLTINRTGAGTTDAFNSGAVIGGNFSFTNNTAGSSLFGVVTRRTSIAGTINIAINNTTPGSFELLRLINQTGGGTINVQNSIGFDVRNDTLIVSSFNITGYRGSDFGYLYNNDIEGNVTIADDATHTAGYNTYIRANEITGNASFTNNGAATFFDADISGSGNKYIGSVSYIKNGGPITVGTGDTTEITQNLTLNSSTGITLSKIKFNGSTDGVIEQSGIQPIIIPEFIMEKTGTGKITLNDSVTVSTSLFFNGGVIVSSPTNKLIFLDNATHSGSSDASYVNGAVVKIGNDAFTFPVGQVNEIAQIRISAPANATDAFRAQYFNNPPQSAGYDTTMKDPTLDHLSREEYWLLDRTAGTSSNVVVTLSWDTDRSGTVNNMPDLRVARWNNTMWKDEGNGGTTGTNDSGYVQSAAAVSSFGPFTLASTSQFNPLKQPSASNQPPVVTASGGNTSFTEGTVVVVDDAITVTDADNANLVSATVSITGGFQSGEDVLLFTNQNGITGSYNATTGVLSLSGSSSVANYQTALRSVTYNNTSLNPNTANRTISFQVNDGSANSNIATKTVTVTAVNQAPVVTSSGGNTAYTSGTPVVVDGAITVSDVDNANLASATVSITGGFQSSEDVLLFTNQNGITGSYNAGTGILTLTGSATVANYQTALRSVMYNNTSSNPNTANRTISFQVNDGTVNSNIATKTVTVTAVNQAPVVTSSGGNTAYTSGTPVVVDGAITVSDVDNANLASATVSITGGFQSSEDVLLFTNQSGITGSYNAATGVLTLTGSATVANYQTALRSVMYNNTSSTPNTTARTISFQVNDGTANSNVATKIVTLTAAPNNPPVVTASGGNTSYTEGTPVVVDGAITVSDADNANLVSATVTITGGFQSSEDVLLFTNQSGITGSYNAATGMLTLTGSATVANYQTALRSVMYNNTSSNPNTANRTISFQVNDGSANSNITIKTVTVTAVNQASVITSSAGNTNYTSPTEVVVDAAITVSDVDNANLASATVSITGGFQSSEDVLLFTNQNGITGSYNASTGVLTLTGTSSVANYQVGLRSVMYDNTSSTPNTTDRIVSFQVNDGTANSSMATKTIVILAAALPVTLSSFSVQSNQCTALLKWTTASEQNSKHFEVLHSTDGTAFTPIGIVAASGNSNIDKHYIFNASLAEGVNYYRLHMVDKDGSSKLSAIVSARSNCNTNIITLYPNPAKSMVTINGLRGANHLRLVDNLGKLVKSIRTTNLSETINLSGLSAGIYMLQVIQNDKLIQTIKVVKE